jgi:hypothetical protein
VQPQVGDCAFNPNLSMQPLMQNWTEATTSRRDRFDYDNGRGRGNVKVIAVVDSLQHHVYLNSS